MLPTIILAARMKKKKLQQKRVEHLEGYQKYLPNHLDASEYFPRHVHNFSITFIGVVHSINLQKKVDMQVHCPEFFCTAANANIRYQSSDIRQAHLISSTKATHFPHFSNSIAFIAEKPLPSRYSHLFRFRNICAI